MTDQQPDRTCQWVDYGQYECENPVDETVSVMGTEIDLCESHARTIKNTQL